MPDLNLPWSNCSVLLPVTSKGRWKGQEQVLPLWLLLFKVFNSLLPFLISVFFFFFLGQEVQNFFSLLVSSISACSCCLSLSPFLHILWNAASRTYSGLQQKSSNSAKGCLTNVPPIYIPSIYLFCSSSTSSSHLMPKTESPAGSLYCGACCVSSCPSRGV